MATVTEEISRENRLMKLVTSSKNEDGIVHRSSTYYMVRKEIGLTNVHVKNMYESGILYENIENGTILHKETRSVHATQVNVDEIQDLLNKTGLNIPESPRSIKAYESRGKKKKKDDSDENEDIEPESNVEIEKENENENENEDENGDQNGDDDNSNESNTQEENVQSRVGPTDPRLRRRQQSVIDLTEQAEGNRSQSDSQSPSQHSQQSQHSQHSQHSQQSGERIQIQSSIQSNVESVHAENGSEHSQHTEQSQHSPQSRQLDENKDELYETPKTVQTDRSGNRGIQMPIPQSVKERQEEMEEQLRQRIKTQNDKHSMRMQQLSIRRKEFEEESEKLRKMKADFEKQKQIEMKKLEEMKQNLKKKHVKKSKKKKQFFNLHTSESKSDDDENANANENENADDNESLTSEQLRNITLRGKKKKKKKKSKSQAEMEKEREEEDEQEKKYAKEMEGSFWHDDVPYKPNELENIDGIYYTPTFQFITEMLFAERAEVRDNGIYRVEEPKERFATRLSLKSMHKYWGTTDADLNLDEDKEDEDFDIHQGEYSGYDREEKGVSFDPKTTILGPGLQRDLEQIAALQREDDRIRGQFTPRTPNANATTTTQTTSIPMTPTPSKNVIRSLVTGQPITQTSNMIQMTEVIRSKPEYQQMQQQGIASGTASVHLSYFQQFKEKVRKRRQSRFGSTTTGTPTTTTLTPTTPATQRTTPTTRQTLPATTPQPQPSSRTRPQSQALGSDRDRYAPPTSRRRLTDSKSQSESKTQSNSKSQLSERLQSKQEIEYDDESHPIRFPSIITSKTEKLTIANTKPNEDTVISDTAIAQYLEALIVSYSEPIDVSVRLSNQFTPEVKSKVAKIFDQVNEDLMKSRVARVLRLESILRILQQRIRVTEQSRKRKSKRDSDVSIHDSDDNVVRDLNATAFGTSPSTTKVPMRTPAQKGKQTQKGKRRLPPVGRTPLTRMHRRGTTGRTTTTVTTRAKGGNGNGDDGSSDNGNGDNGNGDNGNGAGQGGQPPASGGSGPPPSGGSGPPGGGPPTGPAIPPAPTAPILDPNQQFMKTLAEGMTTAMNNQTQLMSQLFNNTNAPTTNVTPRQTEYEKQVERIQAQRNLTYEGASFSGQGDDATRRINFVVWLQGILKFADESKLRDTHEEILVKLIEKSLTNTAKKRYDSRIATNGQFNNFDTFLNWMFGLYPLEDTLRYFYEACSKCELDWKAKAHDLLTPYKRVAEYYDQVKGYSAPQIQAMYDLTSTQHALRAFSKLSKGLQNKITNRCNIAGTGLPITLQALEDMIVEIYAVEYDLKLNTMNPYRTTNLSKTNQNKLLGKQINIAQSVNATQQSNPNRSGKNQRKTRGKGKGNKSGKPYRGRRYQGKGFRGGGNRGKGDRGGKSKGGRGKSRGRGRGYRGRGNRGGRGGSRGRGRDRSFSTRSKRSTSYSDSKSRSGAYHPKFNPTLRKGASKDERYNFYFFSQACNECGYKGHRKMHHDLLSLEDKKVLSQRASVVGAISERSGYNEEVTSKVMTSYLDTINMSKGNMKRKAINLVQTEESQRSSQGNNKNVSTLGLLQQASDQDNSNHITQQRNNSTTQRHVYYENSNTNNNNNQQ